MKECFKILPGVMLPADYLAVMVLLSLSREPTNLPNYVISLHKNEGVLEVKVLITVSINC